MNKLSVKINTVIAAFAVAINALQQLQGEIETSKSPTPRCGRPPKNPQPLPEKETDSRTDSSLHAYPYIGTTKVVQKLWRDLPESERLHLSKMEEKELIGLHHYYGRYIRNKFLWGRDNLPCHPDTLSQKIIRKLWKRSRKVKTV